jgi:putative transposase
MRSESGVGPAPTPLSFVRTAGQWNDTAVTRLRDDGAYSRPIEVTSVARQPRYALPGLPQHVTHRGHNRSPMFVAVEDYLLFRDSLLWACARHECDLHAYVLMTNHVHLLLTPRTGDGIPKMMQALGVRYVRYFNATYRRTGTLLENRYRATVVESDRYLLHCHRYIELNPVRAGIVADPAQYPWSSFRRNALDLPDPLVTPHPLYQALGADAARRCSEYRALCQSAVDDTTLRAIRVATHTAWALGDDRFRRQLGELASRRVQPLWSRIVDATATASELSIA